MKGMDKNFMKMIQKKCLYMAWGMIFLGALVLANVYWAVVNWPAFIGGILVITGLIKLMMHKKHMI